MSRSSRKPNAATVTDKRERSRNSKHATEGGPHIEIPPRDDKPVAMSDKQAKDQKPIAQMKVHKLERTFVKGIAQIPVLQGVDLSVRHGEFLSIIGQSGSGKSTLLHILGTLDQPDGGEIIFEDRPIHNIPHRQRDRLRSSAFGMIFQFYHLLPEMTTLENVLSPLMIRESLWGYMTRRPKHVATARELLERVGLGHRLTHKPSELSGGEMQRAAIARALVTNPRMLFADEPTGNLDKKTGEEIMTLLTSLNEEQDLTIVMVTHDQWVADQADRTIRLVDGRVERAS